MTLDKTRGAGPVTVTIFKKGQPVKEFTVPAPTIETTRDPVAKRGPKPGSRKSEAAERFLKTANWY